MQREEPPSLEERGLLRMETGEGGETYAAEVFVQQLHISVDQLQCDELIVLALDGAAEVEAGISEDRDT